MSGPNADESGETHDATSEAPPRLGRAAWIVTAVALVLYGVVAAEKPVAILFIWVADEYLFLSQALELVRGHWLGPYWISTLAKGPGYPLFLAANHILGLSVGMGQALLYFGAVVYCARVMMRIFRTQVVFIVTMISLLMIPIFYDQSMQRLLRDTFYTSIVLLYFAALFDLLFVNAHRRRWAQAAVCGLLAGVIWITREEREWIVPASLFVIGAVLWQRRDRWKPLALELAAAVVALAAVLTTIASVNLAHYGRFAINEVKDANFVWAVSALQRASYQDFRPYLPVPKAARLRIYEHSPTFAKLQFFLDPKDGPSPWNYACHEVHTDLCGDIGAGWFLWALRDGAGRVGAHKDPNTAAAFYRSIADEIDTACSRGQLRCGYRMPFIIPYMTAGQIAALPRLMGKALSIVAMREPMSVSPLPSAFRNRKEEVLRLLNHPTHVELSQATVPSPMAPVYSAWLGAVELARRPLSLLIALGFVVFLGMLVVAGRRRETTPALIVLSALWLAVFARVALVSLVEAGSFRALNTTYLAPAVPLAVLAGVVAILVVADVIGHRLVNAIPALTHCRGAA